MTNAFALSSTFNCFIHKFNPHYFPQIHKWKVISTEWQNICHGNYNFSQTDITYITEIWFSFLLLHYLSSSPLFRIQATWLSVTNYTHFTHSHQVLTIVKQCLLQNNDLTIHFTLYHFHYIKFITVKKTNSFISRNTHLNW